MKLIKKSLLFTSSLLFVILAGLSLNTSAHDHIDNVTVELDVEDTILRVTGDTFPSAFITVLVDGGTAGTMTADSSGEFDKSFPSQTPGLHNIKIFAKDLSSNHTTDTVSQNISLQPQTETTVDFFLPSIIELSQTKVQVGDTIRFSGLTIPGGNITLVVDNNLSINTIANSSGRWQIDVDTDGFYIGTHNAYVVVNDGGGAQSSPSQKRLFTVDERSPRLFIDGPPEAEAQPAGQEGELSVPKIDFPRNNQRFTESPIIIRGTGTPNTQIELYDGDELIGSTFINARGEWSISLDLTKDRYDLRLRSCSNDKCSDFSETVTIFYDGPVESLSLRLSQYRFQGVRPEQAIKLEAIVEGGQAPYEIVVDWGDDSVERFSYMDLDELLFLDHAYDNIGNYSGQVSVRDDNDVIRTASFSVDVSEPGSFTWAIPIIIGAIAASGLLALLAFTFKDTLISRFLAAIRSFRSPGPKD